MNIELMKTLEQTLPQPSWGYLCLFSLALFLSTKSKLSIFKKVYLPIDEKTVKIFLFLLFLYCLNVFHYSYKLVYFATSFFEPVQNINISIFLENSDTTFKQTLDVLWRIYNLSLELINLLIISFVFCLTFTFSVFSPLILLRGHRINFRIYLLALIELIIGPVILVMTKEAIHFLLVSLLKSEDDPSFLVFATFISSTFQVMLFLLAYKNLSYLSKSILTNVESVEEKVSPTIVAVIDYSKMSKEQKTIKKLLKLKKFNIKNHKR